MRFPGYSITELIRRYPEDSRLATQPKWNCIFNDFPFRDFGRTVYLPAKHELISHGFLGKWKRQMIYSVYRRYDNRANKRTYAIGAHNVSIYTTQIPSINKCARSPSIKLILLSIFITSPREFNGLDDTRATYRRQIESILGPDKIEADEWFSSFSSERTQRNVKHLSGEIEATEVEQWIYRRDAFPRRNSRTSIVRHTSWSRMTSDPFELSSATRVCL